MLTVAPTTARHRSQTEDAPREEASERWIDYIVPPPRLGQDAARRVEHARPRGEAGAVARRRPRHVGQGDGRRRAGGERREAEENAEAAAKEAAADAVGHAES